MDDFAFKNIKPTKRPVRSIKLPPGTLKRNAPLERTLDDIAMGFQVTSSEGAMEAKVMRTQAVLGYDLKLFVPYGKNEQTYGSLDHSNVNYFINLKGCEGSKVGVREDPDTLSIMERGRLNKELHDISLHLFSHIECVRNSIDELTELNKREQMYGVLGDELTSVRRSKSKGVGVIFIDVDKFKDVNDLYGHQVGDEVLHRTSRVLQSSCRERDEVFRYAGDEFVVVVPDCSHEEVKSIASRMQYSVCSDSKSWNSRKNKGTYPLGITISCGIGYSTQGENDNLSAEQLIGIADDAVANSKRTGRNRVTHLDETGALKSYTSEQ